MRFSPGASPCAPPSSTAAKMFASSRSPFPRPPGELVVQVGAALTCGTDLKVFRRGYHARMIVPPALFGHEQAGTVVEAGEGVSDFAPGDRVVALNSAPCGQCYFCLRGQENLCDDLLFNNGAYAEFIKHSRAHRRQEHPHHS
jgi:threonine dehydrogenase-like Zn-dependent dehydrogenase